MSTRERLVTEAMRLFGEHGYAGTSVGDIEAAAGLSAGAGSLYRHFASKRALLAEGVTRQISAGQSLLALLNAHEDGRELPARQRFAAVAQAGLRRLEQERDLNRILVRDLGQFPDLLVKARDEEVAQVNAATAGWLAAQSALPDRSWDWEALAAVLTGAVTHFWLMTDVFGAHPGGVDEQRFLDALATLLQAANVGGDQQP